MRLIVADLLQDHLLGVLREAAAELLLRQQFLDEFVDLDVGNLVARVGQDDLVPRLLQAGLVGHDQPAAEGLVVAGFAVHRDADVDILLFEQPLGGRGQRRLQRAEHDLARHVLLARKRIDQQKNFTAHSERSFVGAAAARAFDPNST
jgi:hypothetical protein